MLILLSPAKRIDLKIRIAFGQSTRPEFINKAEELAKLLKNHSPDQLARLMGLSDNLAVTNAGRYAEWEHRHDSRNSKQVTFSGFFVDAAPEALCIEAFF